MAIDIKTAWEQDRNGNLFAPRTLVESIQNAEGKSLQELLDEKSGGGSSAIQTDILLTDGIYREGEYSLLHSIDDYDFILVAAYTYSDTTGQNSVIQSQLIAKHDYYYYPASGKDGTSFTITGTMNEHDRRVLFCFLDSTTIKIKATTTPSVIKTIYGINIKTSTPINNKVSTVVSYAAEPQTTPVTLHGHIQFNTVVLDTANCWDAEDYSFVTPIDGIYNINFCCYVSSSTTLNRVAIETKHGDEIWKTRAVANGYNNGASINLNWYLEKNDRVRLTTGGDSYYVTFYPISNHNTFSIALLGGGLSTGDLIDVDDELSDTSTNPVQNKVITKKLDEVFQSVSSGKEKIAAAITDKGVETAADATFDVMAENIGNIISSGMDISITQLYNLLLYRTACNSNNNRGIQHNGFELSSTIGDTVITQYKLGENLSGKPLIFTTLAFNTTYRYGFGFIAPYDYIIDTDYSVDTNYVYAENITTFRGHKIIMYYPKTVFNSASTGINCKINNSTYYIQNTTISTPNWYSTVDTCKILADYLLFGER